MQLAEHPGVPALSRPNISFYQALAWHIILWAAGDLNITGVPLPERNPRNCGCFLKWRQNAHSNVEGISKMAGGDSVPDEFELEKLRAEIQQEKQMK